MSKNKFIEILLPDANATQAIGILLGQHLLAGTVLLLQGELGSGKTTLVQGIAAGLGITESVDSPTFTLINEYLEGRIPLYHLDLYRLTPAETAALNLETYWEGKEVTPGIIAIEWADRLPYFPTQYLQVLLSYQNDENQNDENQNDQSRRMLLRAIGNLNPGIALETLVLALTTSN